MEKAVALANNDVVLVAWSYDKAIPDCLGFAIRRREAGGVTTVLPAWVGFHGEANPDWEPRDTEEWPVQKFFWRDLTATWGHTYSYEIVPRLGKPGKLKSADDRTLETDEVTLTPTCSTNVSAYFNRGILSTQALAHALPKKNGEPDGEVLLERIKQPGDPIRTALAGQIVDGLTLLLEGAVRDDSNCHGALYELNDPELVAQLTDPEHVTLVLSEGPGDDGGNHDARESLHQAKVEVTDRLFHTDDHIGHNKFLVKHAADGTPTSILTGSTNWTHTGICAQANNALLLTDGQLAAAYQAYWDDLKAECPSDPKAKATQSGAFRAKNDKSHGFTVDGAKVTLWFSPNTQLEHKPSHDPPAPSDMAQVFDLIHGAKEGILFLLFQPGTPCILDAVSEAQEKKPELFVRGAATDASMIAKYEATLYHRGEEPQVAAAVVPDDPIGDMQKELLKTPGAHAIIHDKIVVIDPRSSGCKVITGSHNLGYKASYANDENLLIVEGHRRLAEAYATHVMDIYDHYRWRWQVSKWQRRQGGADPGSVHDAEDGGGLSADDGWQDDYFGDKTAEAERSFWL